MLSALISSAGRKPAMLLAKQLAHESCVRPGPLVLGTALLKSLTPTEDRDRTVSRRSKPSSRTALMGEQPNPWDLLPPQDVMIRHRGAKPCRRCGLLGKISLLSPGYLLSVDRPRFHMPWPGH
jgi:Cell wall-associated hydrolase.